ncbi:MAG: Tfp pilus assembly protein PilF [Parcubacteria group bacterium Athens0714_16]|nr:MAG: Tfp pilus assembly protein PilF [Parcubacteria group bacterium Athens0714_16]
MKKVFDFEKVSFVVLFLTIFLTPFFFIPSSSVGFNSVKTFLLYAGVILSFIFWFVAKLKEGKFEFPKSILFIFAGIVPLIYLISSLFSSSMKTSLLGAGFEIDSFVTIVALFLLFILTTLLFKSKQKLLYLYMGFFVSVILVILFQFLRLVFGPEFLSLGVFFSPISSLIGKWNDLAIFFGLSMVLMMSILEFLNITKLMKIVSYIILLFSVVFLAIINFAMVWFAVGIFSLILFVYSLMFKTKEQMDNISENDVSVKKKFPLISLVVFVISIAFVISGGFFTETIASTFGISQLEARPSWQSTFEIAGKTFEESPVLGVGPNRFSSEWLKNKPEGINTTIFWNTDFNSGVSYIFSSIVTTGVLGFLSWILFIVVFLFVSVKGVFNLKEDLVKKSIVISSFFGSVYLWAFSILYVPDIAMLSLTFVFSGILIASLYNDEAIKKTNISFSKDSKMGIVVISVSVILLAATVLWGVFVTKKFVSNVYFQKGVIAANVSGDVALSESNIKTAIKFDKNDLFYRTLVQIDLVKLNQIAGQKDVEAKVLQEQFQNALGEAIDNAKTAVSIDGTNYLNWLVLGNVYEVVVPLKVEGAYQSAMASYQEALKYNSQSPSIYLTMAKLEVLNKDIKKAKALIKTSLEKKNNYTEAFFLLSQIEVDQGNISAAISSVESASTLSPNDPTVFFYLGLLKYNNKNYSDAITALERSVILSPTYSNAKYFLGLSYQKVNRVTDAVAQFEDVKTLNPDNKEVEQILTNLKNGKDPFAGSATEQKPENREELPVKEKTQ